MKIFFYCLLLLSFLSVPSIAQTTPNALKIPTVVINAKIIGKDSVIIPYNDRYWVVPDSCTQIIRYGHYNFKGKFFYGKFKDVKKDDTTKIVALGAYSNKGLKNGLFQFYYLDGKIMANGSFIANKYDGNWVFYYPNGQLKAKGTFKENSYIGKWELYYENGRPELFFEGKNGICNILNAWRTDGVKTVNEGNGSYDSEGAHWVGNLRNGLPDSIWTCNSLGASVTEYFKQNIFYRGHSEYGAFVQDYKDESHISLFPALPVFQLDHGTYFDISTTCDGKGTQEVYVKIFDKVLHQFVYPSKNSTASQ
jgi:antitoxin component YwqK of YwqJK toxin-antitoxin module